MPKKKGKGTAPPKGKPPIPRRGAPIGEVKKPPKGVMY